MPRGVGGGKRYFSCASRLASFASSAMAASLHEVASSIGESPPDTLKEVLRKQGRASELLLGAAKSQQASKVASRGRPSEFGVIACAVTRSLPNAGRCGEDSIGHRRWRGGGRAGPGATTASITVILITLC